MKSAKFIGGASLVLTFALLMGFNNCSGVKFDTSPELLKQQAFEFSSNSSIRINGGAPFTNLKVVQLSLSSPRAVTMKISNLPDCSDGTMEPFTTAKPWTLSKTNDNVSVYAQYIDLRGDVSPCAQASIVHDDIAPDATFAQASGAITNISALTVSWAAHDNLSGIDQSLCSTNGAVATACDSQLKISASKEGTNSTVVRLTDKAGNTSRDYTFNWLLDTTLPVVTIHSQPSSTTGSATAQLGFSASDVGSGVATLFCHLDQGAFQTCVSPVAYATLSQGAHLFEVYAVDKAGNKSATVGANWTIDLTAPNIRFTQTPAAAANSTQGIFGFSGDKNGQPISIFKCQLDAAAYAACISPATLNGLGEGAHTFSFTGTDGLGNVSSPLTYKWVVDLTPPVVNIVVGPSGVTSRAQASLQWTATDALSGVNLVECRLDGATYQPCSLGSINYNGLTEGAHKFDVRATDAAGNVASATRSWNEDLTPPQLTITSGPGAYTSNLTPQFTFQATDASGVASYACRVDNAAFTPCTSPYIVSNLLEGGHVLYVTATDRAGNTSDPANYAWTLDLSPPILRIISSPVSIKAGDHAVIDYAVVDLGSGLASVQCGLTLPSGVVAACQASATLDLGAMNTGNYTFTITATDKVGNSITDTASFQVNSRPVICDPFVVGGEATCNGGLTGDIYYLDATGQKQFQALGTKTVDYFYSNGIKVNALLDLKQLNVSTRSFTAGFPTSGGQLIQDNSGNVLNSYFAFHLHSVLKLDALNDQPGWYQFATLSDDGSMISMTPTGATASTVLIANDGDHPTRMGCSTQAVYIDDTTRLGMEFKYYQGPPTEIALVFMWKKVSGPTVALDANCGATSSTAFYGAGFNDYTNYTYGHLVASGWRVVAPANFIAPP